MPETSWLQECVDRVRLLAQEPANNAQSTNDELVRHYIYPSTGDVYNRCFMGRDNLILLEYDVDFISTTRYYKLPPNIRHLWRIVRYNTDNEIIDEFEPRNSRDWYGPGWRLNGDTIELRPKFWKTTAETWKIIYSPSGDVLFHEGDGTEGNTSDDITFTLDSAPTLGRLDKRENAYAGCVLRILDGTEYQERLITAYDPQTRTATVRLAFDPVLNTGTIQYEIVPPPGTAQFYDAVALRSILRLMSAKRASPADLRNYQREYLSSLKALNDTLRFQQARTPLKFERRTVDSPDDPFREFGLPTIL